MNEWVSRWWLDAIMGGMLAMLGAGYRWLRHKMKLTVAENAALREGIKALLRDRIAQAYDYHMKKGYWPVYARESVMGMYAQYRALGGNGLIGDLMETLRDLPTGERDEPRAG